MIRSPGIIPRVSKVLAGLITAEMRLELLSDWSVTFESPAELDTSGGLRLSLYLYLIELNTALREVSGTVSRASTLNATVGKHAAPMVEWTPPPTVVDLHYMIVPYSHSAELELEISDCLVRALDRCGAIPDRYLDDELRKSGNSDMRVIPQFASIHTLRDLWSCFPQKMFRLTRLYTVSPVRIPVGAPTDVASVATVDLGLTLTPDDSNPLLDGRRT